MEMKTVVLLKMVPDVVEELAIAPSGKSLANSSLHWIPNESDEHALEQALILREQEGGSVTTLALDAPGVEEALIAARVRGADRAIRITRLSPGLTSAEEADVFARVVRSEIGAMPDLILTGVQAIDDLDGLIGPLVACLLGLPFLGVVVGLKPSPAGDGVVAIKECTGGVRAEFDVDLPAVIGVQAAERPPRYVPLAKLHDAAQSIAVESLPVPLPADPMTPLIEVLHMRRRLPANRTEMLAGSLEQVAGRFRDILAAREVI